MPLAPDLRRAIVDGLRRLYGARLRRVVLFGSEARGDARADSDVDVLVVLAGEVGADEREARGDLAGDLLFEHLRLVGFVLVPEEVYLHGDWPLLTNVRREGVALWSADEVAVG